MADGDFKDLVRRTALDRVLCVKIFNIANIAKHGWYQRSLASMLYKYFDKKSSSGSSFKSSIKQNEQLVEKIHKPIIKTFKTPSIFII